MAKLVGRYDRQLDPKGRLALPAIFRQEFKAEAYLTFGDDGCVDAFTPEEHDRMADLMLAKVERGEIERTALVVKASSTVMVPIDAQGRILVDQQLRAKAGLGLNTRVVVTGAYDRVQIWNAERFEEVDGAG